MSGPIHLGTSGWPYADCVGPFYPAGTAPSAYLAEFARHFQAVEVDSTFYRIPTERMVDGWARATSAGFLFAPKFPQVITHEKHLQGCEPERDLFLARVERLGGQARCGAIPIRPMTQDDMREALNLGAERTAESRGGAV